MSDRPFQPDPSDPPATPPTDPGQTGFAAGDAELAALDRRLAASLRIEAPGDLADRLAMAVVMDGPLRLALGTPAVCEGLSDRVFAATVPHLECRHGEHRRLVVHRFAAAGWIGAAAAVLGLAVTIGLWVASQQNHRLLARVNAEVATVDFEPVRTPLDSQLQDLQAEVQRVADSVQNPDPGFDVALASPAEQFPDDLLQLEYEVQSF